MLKVALHTITLTKASLTVLLYYQLDFYENLDSTVYYIYWLLKCMFLHVPCMNQKKDEE